MIWALKDGNRVLAERGKEAVCPLCLSQVTPKCGQIKTHHWAHTANECDSFKNGETPWHYQWKQRFPQEMQEIIIKKGKEIHRADVFTGSKVVEFQKSSISCEAIADREAFYGNMVWVLDGYDFANNFICRDKDVYQTFRWKWPRFSWAHANRPVFIDFRSSIFQVKKIYGNTPCGGWGFCWGVSEFVDWARN